MGYLFIKMDTLFNTAQKKVVAAVLTGTVVAYAIIR